MNEHGIQSSILDYLAKRRIFHYRNNSGAFEGISTSYPHKKRFVRFGTPGSPDIICVIEGRYVGIEVKAPKKKQNENQVAFAEKLKAAGGIYFVVHSIDEAMEAIEDAILRLHHNPNT